MIEEQLSVQIVSSLLKLAFLVLWEHTYCHTAAKLKSSSPNTGTGDFSSAFLSLPLLSSPFPLSVECQSGSWWLLS
jgi:hypothetical protein